MILGLLFVIGFLALLGLAFRHPVYGVYAYLAAFFVHPPSRWWGDALPDLRWSLLPAAVTLVAVLVHNRRPLRREPWVSSGATVILLLYCGWLWIQWPWALDRVAHYDAAVRYSKYMLASYLIFRAADSEERVRDLLIAFVAGCALLGVMALYAPADSYVDGRLNGVGGPGIDDANSLAMMLATGTVAGGMLILAQSGWVRLGVVLGIPFIVNAMILAGSRGAFLGTIVGGLVLFLLRPKGSERLFWTLAVVGVLGIVSLMDQRFIERMFTIRQAIEDVSQADLSAQSRRELHEAQLRMFAAHPLGTGHKGTSVLSWQYLDERWLASDHYGNKIGRSSHNTFLTALVEQGVIGAALFVSLLLWWAATVARMRRLRRDPARATQTATAGALLGALAVIFTAGNFTDYLMAEVQFWLIALLTAHLRHVLRATAVTTTAVVPRPVDRGVTAEQRTSG